MEKLCCRCGLRPCRRSGYQCLECHNAYQKNYYKTHPQQRNSVSKSSRNRRRERRLYILSAKDKPCLDCGIKYPWYIMEFDHSRGKKKFDLSIAAQRLYSIEAIDKEIAKCDVVCSNCHRERTYKRNQFPDGVTDNMLGFEPRESTFES